MTTREFIGTVSHALGRSTPQTPAPLVYRHSVQVDVMQEYSQDELTTAFADYSRIIGVTVFMTTKERFPTTLVEAVKSCSAGNIVLADDPLLNELGAAQALSDVAPAQVWDTNSTWEKNVRLAENAAVGIAVARMALAESATVLLYSHGGTGRSVTLLPESTIYIIRKSMIRPRLTQGMAYLQDHQNELPSSVNFVSGPSATSDIELVRVVGVHGPMHVAHIIVTDL
ncbi:lactate utilization protein C [candidate division KSB1 bacterium]|nr:lactate utilization protein C [candidate division KSB1 bacterium]